MTDELLHGRAGDERREDPMERVSFLRKQADWCVEMAAKALGPKMFQKYLDLAAAYQQQAVELERYIRPEKAVRTPA